MRDALSNRLRALAPSGFLVLLLLLLGALLRLHQGTDLEGAGVVHLVYYALLAYSLVLFHCRLFGVSARQRLILTLFAFWKLPLTGLLVYLLIHRYEGGDFGYYFYTPVAAIQGYHSYDPATILGNGAMTVSLLIYFLFTFLPVSLYGLGLLFGALSFNAGVIVYKVFEPHARSTGQLILVLFGLPSIALQSAYIGKDGLTLYLTALLVYSISRLVQRENAGRQIKWLVLAAATLVGIDLLRAYQCAMIAVAVYIFATFHSRRLVRTVLLIVAGAGLWIIAQTNWIHHFLWTYEEERLSFDNLINALATTYEGGSLMLRPFPFPFQLLQVFRPFPWEANNMLALLSSVETGCILLFVLIRLLFYSVRILRNIRQQPIYQFVSIYTVLFMVAFSFSSNMGDLSRRRIYFMHFLLAIVLPAKEIPWARMTGAPKGRGVPSDG